METYNANKTTPEVRQGSRRMMNLRVLIWSLLGVIIAFAIIYFAFFAAAPGPGTAT